MTLPEPGSELTDRIIGLGIKVHQRLGPGLLESVHQHCLCWEFQHDNLAFQREVPLPIVYEDVRLTCGYQADIILAQTVLIELKSVERILPVHEAQTLTGSKWPGLTRPSTRAAVRSAC
jgi:GxxExxY protein